MLNLAFGLPATDLGDRIVSRLMDEQQKQVDHFRQVVYDEITKALDNPAIISGWEIIENGTVRETDYYQFSIPFDYSVIPEKQSSHILTEIPKYFTNQEKTHKVSLVFIKPESQIVVSVELL